MKQLLFAFLLVFSLLSAPPATAAVRPVDVCVTCHGALSARLGMPAKLWKASIHAEHGVSCNACHGGDPMDGANSMSPARGFRGVPIATEIPTICGGCHMGIAKYNAASPHGKALGRGGPTCVTCHGSHGVVKATIDQINRKNCTPCHGFESAWEIRNAMLKTDGMLKAIEDRIIELKNQGILTDTLEKRLFALRNQSHSLFHTLNIDLIRQESAHLQAELEKNNGIGNTGTGLSIGALAVGWALLAALLFYLIKKNID